MVSGWRSGRRVGCGGVPSPPPAWWLMPTARTTTMTPPRRSRWPTSCRPRFRVRPCGASASHNAVVDIAVAIVGGDAHRAVPAVSRLVAEGVPAIPGPEEHFAQPLALTLGRDHHVHAPGARHLVAFDREAHGHRGVLADDGRAFARDPDLGLAAGVVRVAAVLPLPAQPARVGGVVAEHAPVEGIDRAPVVGRYCSTSGYAPPGVARRLTRQHVLHVADENVWTSATVPDGGGQHRRKAPHRRRDVQLFADDSRGRRRRSAREPRHVTFSSRSSCLISPLRASCDERVLVRRLLQRPRRVARQERERRERDCAGRRAGAAAPESSAAAGALPQTTDTAPSTGRRGRPRASTRAHSRR